MTQNLHSVSISFVPELIHGKRIRSEPKNKDQQQDPQQKRDQGQGQSQDFGKKNSNQEIPDGKNREGSEEVEKRRES